jgi:hypothetical protein
MSSDGISSSTAQSLCHGCLVMRWPAMALCGWVAASEPKLCFNLQPAQWSEGMLPSERLYSKLARVPAAVIRPALTLVLLAQCNR